jgi:hypothetical protein
MSDDLRHHGDLDLAPGLVDLAVNVRAGTPPAWLRAALARVDLARYPDQRDALAAVAARHGRAPSEVLLTAGAAEAFVLLARALTPRCAVVAAVSASAGGQSEQRAGRPDPLKEPAAGQLVDHPLPFPVELLVARDAGGVQGYWHANSSAGIRRRTAGMTRGVPDSGSSMMRQRRPNTSATSASVTMSRGRPSATIRPSHMAIRYVA